VTDLLLSGQIQAAQLPFFRARARHIAYGGARGGGKSWAMRRKFVLLAATYPGLKLMLLRRTLPELRENHINPLSAELMSFCRYSDDQKAFSFPNGSRLKLGYCDAERDVYQYQGQEWDCVGFEEATHFTESMVEFILTANRSTRKDFSPRAYYTSNPGNVGHAWFKRLFVDRAFRPTERPEDYVFFRARLYDNPALMEADPGYERTLLNLPEDLRRAHLEGDWDVFAGQVFKEFRREVHVCQPFPIPGHWRRWLSNDPGYHDAATWYWHAADEGGRVWTYRERVFHGVTAGDQAAEVMRLSAGEHLDFLVTGHDATSTRGNAEKTFADYYVEAGLPLPMPRSSDGDRINFNRAMVVHEYLRPVTIPADAEKNQPERVEGRVCIFSTCPYLVRTLPLLVYDDKNPEAIKPGDDHGYDGWSYGIQAWHIRKSDAPAKPPPKPTSFAAMLGHDKVGPKPPPSGNLLRRR
jgi:phage terminase large subunit